MMIYFSLLDYYMSLGTFLSLSCCFPFLSYCLAFAVGWGVYFSPALKGSNKLEMNQKSVCGREN